MQRRSFFTLCLGALASVLLAGPAAAVPPLTVGLIPAEDSQAMLENSKAVIDSLQQQLGMPVKPFIATDYNGIIEALRSRKLDVAYLGPFSYVLASSVANVEAFAVAETKKSGRSFYKSLIITRKESGLQSLEQLKGRTMAFVDPSSASGHLFPSAGLQKLNIDPNKYFSRVIFSGSHDASILAAAVAKGVVQQSELNVVWTSPDIPESPMVWRKDLDPALKQKIAAAFANIKDVKWGDQGVLNGFVPTTDGAYDVVRETAKILNLDLKAMK
ncbi:phosphonate transport system substrate-binding protein [Herbaspirillum sp. 1173]|uniref:phosphate/phosphite/phosphonate ABC transporter substrate-binding protein n=1 Tax=Herbaspirillum sp. 1173 TaxID=2817734 RepID=UPI002859A428|nr:phosphate/phosphite/phosphonate ABC transporter substrate-binding protein [Herbaspirillum sp. 1173]MDR6738962.1 phosphonate transport system substrate-binding protein [Herbaspirillum sp. 1173]